MIQQINCTKISYNCTTSNRLFHLKTRQVFENYASASRIVSRNLKNKRAFNSSLNSDMNSILCHRIVTMYRQSRERHPLYIKIDMRIKYDGTESKSAGVQSEDVNSYNFRYLTKKKVPEFSYTNMCVHLETFCFPTVRNW